MVCRFNFQLEWMDYLIFIFSVLATRQSGERSGLTVGSLGFCGYLCLSCYLKININKNKYNRLFYSTIYKAHILFNRNCSKLWFPYFPISWTILLVFNRISTRDRGIPLYIHTWTMPGRCRSRPPREGRGIAGRRHYWEPPRHHAQALPYFCI